MSAFILRRLGWMAVLLVFLSLVTFVVFYLFPSVDPAVLRAGRQPTPQIVAAIRRQLGLDRSVLTQFWLYVRDIVLHFDFGTSYQNQEPVRGELLARVPATAGLVVEAAAIWLTSGLLVGVVSSIRRGSFLDRATMSGALVLLSAPSYWLGLVALYLFSKGIGVVHVFDGAGSYPLDGSNLFDAPLQVAPKLLLPALTLAASLSAIYARFVRSSMLEVLSQDYIRTARAKGLPEWRVMSRHALRPASLPVLTLLGLDLGVLLGGTILIEQVFNIPGVGLLVLRSVQEGDLPTIQGAVLMGGFAVIAMSIVVDIAYGILDPRVRSHLK